jgi:ABC-type sugar transport system ATPase subunit
MELYHTPANIFVARFIGSPSMNTVPCVVEAGGLDARVKPLGAMSVKVEEVIPQSAVGKPATFGARPEDLTVTTGNDAIFKGTIDIVEKLGEVTMIYVDCGNTEEPIVAKLDGNVDLAKGATVSLTAPINTLHVFDEHGKAFPRKS